MNFKANVPVPPGVEIERYKSTVQIDNGDSTKDFFTSNPSLTGEIDQNYDTNPLPDDYFHVVLAASISPLTRLIRQDSNIDPAYVVNNLFDSNFKISSNKGRQQEINHPLKDYMNANITAASSHVISGTPDVATLTVALGSTGRRYMDNLFFIKPYEPFSASVTFNSGTWPTTANWTSAGIGRFGLRCEMWFAKMTKEQLNAYNGKLVNAAGYGKNFGANTQIV